MYYILMVDMDTNEDEAFIDTYSAEYSRIHHTTKESAILERYNAQKNNPGLAGHKMWIKEVE